MTRISASPRRGFTLLITILIVSIVLAIGLSILAITLKEFTLSVAARESALAFYAADAGMECALYFDRSAASGNTFDIGPGVRNIPCMGTTSSFAGPVANGQEQSFEFSWGAPAVCARISVTKYVGPILMDNGANCPSGVECTRALSYGYNKACADIASARTVERGLRARY